jgi:hypothetical protein
MAAFVPPVVGGLVGGAAAYQAWNPAKRQDKQAGKNAPRNGQDWRLNEAGGAENLRIPDYWRNSVDRPTHPVEDAYRSTYNNMYTNGPKLMEDALTGQLRWITPDGNSTNSVIIDHPVRCDCVVSWLTRTGVRPGERAAQAAGGEPHGAQQQALHDADQIAVIYSLSKTLYVIILIPQALC